jgi:hypothetical protein
MPETITLFLELCLELAAGGTRIITNASWQKQFGKCTKINKTNNNPKHTHMYTHTHRVNMSVWVCVCVCVCV